MPRATLRPAFFKGMRDGAPFLLVIAPFGLLFGVVAREAGWNVAEILAMSVVVIAGASQFTALQLMEENAPTLIVILTALAVNLRHAMYSASLAPHLGPTPLWKRALIAYCLVDQTYGTSMNRYAATPGMSPAEKTAFFFGVAAGDLPGLVRRSRWRGRWPARRSRRPSRSTSRCRSPSSRCSRRRCAACRTSRRRSSRWP